MQQYLGNNCTVQIQPFQKSTGTLITESGEEEDAFFLCDLGDVIKKYKNWKEKLPRVHPFYAVKCNEDPAVLKVLAKLGASFDCASKVEIEKILKLGIPPSRIIFANACKQPSFIRYAKKHHVDMMTFDNEAELHKIKNIYPDAKLVLRILPPRGFKVRFDLGMKFGCHPKRARHLLQVAKSLDLNIMGISFHVGTGLEDPEAFVAAISVARDVCDMATEAGYNINLLDIGGGFPGRKSSSLLFKEIAGVINRALDQFFPAGTGIKVVAEPGTYFTASAFTLVVNVIAMDVMNRDTYLIDVNEISNMDPATGNDDQDDVLTVMYYVNDGVYGSLNCVFNNPSEELRVHSLKDRDEMRFNSTLWGPTCDSSDCIIKDIPLPKLDIGDWLYVEDTGAYTLSTACSFNGMPIPKCHYYSTKETWFMAFPVNTDDVQRG